MLSIIIPTYNEEKNLEILLSDISSQTYKDFEVIVADAASIDSTVEVAKKSDVKIVFDKVHGGGPAYGRNAGADAAKGSILLFIDADSRLENDFLEKAIGEIKKRNLGIAGVWLKPVGNRLFDRLFLLPFNSWSYITQATIPHSVGTGLFCESNIHDEIGGFDPKIICAEDMDYVRRASKVGKFRLLVAVNIGFSMRRFHKHGYLKLGSKIFLGAIYRMIFGEMKKDIFNYDFRYKNAKK